MKFTEIQNFGPIEKNEADIELKPLTIFMGDNSSGKTLTAMLFYHTFLSFKIFPGMANKYFEDNVFAVEELQQYDFVKNFEEQIKDIKFDILVEGEEKFEFKVKITKDDIVRLEELEKKNNNFSYI